MKGAIIFKGKYGATQQYATWLGHVLELPVIELADAGPVVIDQFDYLLLGSSVYIGKTQHKEWLEMNKTLLQRKKLFHFIVCGTPLSEKQKLENIIEKNIPPSLLQPSSVWFLRGRIIKKKLSWKDRMMLEIGAKLEKSPEVRKNMLNDYDEVRQENLSSMVQAVMIYARQQKDRLQMLQDVRMT